MKTKMILRLAWFLFRNHALIMFYRRVMTLRTIKPTTWKLWKGALMCGISGAFLWPNKEAQFWRDLDNRFTNKYK